MTAVSNPSEVKRPWLYNIAILEIYVGLSICLHRIDQCKQFCIKNEENGHFLIAGTPGVRTFLSGL